MRALAAVCQVHGRPLTIEEIEVARPGPRQVRVSVEVCAICHSDITYAEGGWGGNLPAVYGHEAAGVVESVGSDVAGLHPGQRVVVGLIRSCGDCYHCVRDEHHLCRGVFPSSSPFTGSSGEPLTHGLNVGAFASVTVVDRSQVVPIPDDVSLQAASLLPCGVITGYGSVVNTARMPAGATAAVIGLGGVGLSALQAVIDVQASHVIAIDVVPEKLATAKRYGAHTTINARIDDPVTTARATTRGVGPDYVFVTVGSSVAIDQGLAMLRAGGTIVMVGMPATGMVTPLEISNLSAAGQRILGSKMGSGRMAVDIPILIDRYRAGAIDLDGMVSNVYPVQAINEAITEVSGGTVVRNLVHFSGQ